MTFTSENNHGELYNKSCRCLLTSRPYGIRLDFKRKGFVIFNHHMNLLGNATPCNVDLLPLEICTLEDIPQTGEKIIKKGDIMDIFFYDETSNPYTGYGVDLEKLKTYNKYIYPLALALNRTL